MLPTVHTLEGQVEPGLNRAWEYRLCVGTYQGATDPFQVDCHLQVVSFHIAHLLLRVTWQEDAHTCPNIGNVEWRSHSMQGEYSSV